MTDMRFMEDINNILYSGEVPNIFAIDEKQEVIESMRDSLRSLTTFKAGTQTKTQLERDANGHYRQYSLSDKTVATAQDEAEKEFENWILRGEGDIGAKIQITLGLVNQFGVDMPKIECLRTASQQQP